MVNRRRMGAKEGKDDTGRSWRMMGATGSDPAVRPPLVGITWPARASMHVLQIHREQDDEEHGDHGGEDGGEVGEQTITAEEVER